MSMPRLSIVMPAYNEEAGIEQVIQEIQVHVFGVVPDAELVVVDDGSRDRTGEMLDRLASAEPRLRIIHQANAGHGPALRTGLDVAQGEFLVLLDSDRQIPLDWFVSLWKLAQERDAAFGVRKHRKDPWVRIELTRLVRGTTRLLFGICLRDGNVPFKIVRRTGWLAARPLIPPGTLAPSLFLAILLKKAGANVAEMEVEHRERGTGDCSIRRWRLFVFCCRAFIQLLAFRSRLKRWAANHTSLSSVPDLPA